MCFSATASFTVAAALAVTGTAAVGAAKTQPDRFLAATPLFFAVHQLVEGVVWLTWNTIAATLFYSIAVAFWPTWTPLVIRNMETDPARRRILRRLLLLGGSISTVTVLYIAWGGVDFGVVNRHLYYEFRALQNPQILYGGMILYAMTTLGPLLLSSVRDIRIMGYIVAAFGALSLTVFSATYISVWCFFAAALSIGVFAIVLRKHQPLMQPIGLS